MKAIRKLTRSVKDLSRGHARSISRSHGASGKLQDLLLEGGSSKWVQLYNEASTLRRVSLSKRQLCDLELLLNGGFSPLCGFMNKDEYDRVCSEMRLPDGTLFPMPITLDIPEPVEKNERIALMQDDLLLAVMTVEDVWKPSKSLEMEKVFGGDPEHPAVSYLQSSTHDYYVGGTVEGLSLPPHYDYNELRKTPQQLRDHFERAGLDKVVAFQTRNPIHRAHFELTKAALGSDPDMHLLVHPVVGQTKPGDIDHHTRMKCYRQVMGHYPSGNSTLSVLPLAMRMAGPREAIWHAIIRKNYGATHFIVGRDHAGPGSNSKGDDFYGPYEARDAVKKLEDELEMHIQSYEMMVYVEERDKYFPINEVPDGLEAKKLSGTKLRALLDDGAPIPEWFSFPEVVNILRKTRRPAEEQGVCVLLTGQSESARKLVGGALQDRFMELDTRSVSIFNDETFWSLGHSNDGPEDLGTQRLGVVASEVVKAGGVAIVTPFTPLPSGREFVRDSCKQHGGFLEVHIDAPPSPALQDSKYVPSSNPDVTIKVPEDTSKFSVEQALDEIVEGLQKKRYLRSAA